jgi:hypothetical protein
LSFDLYVPVEGNLPENLIDDTSIQLSILTRSIGESPQHEYSFERPLSLARVRIRLPHSPARLGLIVRLSSCPRLGSEKATFDIHTRNATPVRLDQRRVHYRAMFVDHLRLPIDS